MMGKNGVYHNLDAIFEQLNQRFFNNQIVANLQWGQSSTQPGKNKRSIRLGSYDPKTKQITIHPSLDQAFVPQLCVERIVYHEMLHQLHPQQIINKRRIIHSKAYRKDEKAFPQAELADRLIGQILTRLLSYRVTFLKN